LKVAIIGAGHMGRLHAEKFARLAGVELVGVADTDRARAEEVAARLGCPALPDWRQAMSRAQAAVVAVPTERHLEVAGACLDAGLHVLVEKPLAVNLEQADRLVASGARKGVVLQVGHVERYNAAFGALAARMAKPLYIEAERLSGFKQRGADIDVVLDLMIHDLDLALSLAKAPVSEVSACGFRVLTEEIDIANARIEFADGCIASLSASRVSQSPVRKLRVFQTDVYVSANLQAGKLRYVRQAGGAIEETEEVHAGGDALSLQAAAFVAAVARQRPVEVSGEHGRRALELALQVGRLVRERMQRATA
jgi:predicted dehydrogenase